MMYNIQYNVMNQGGGFSPPLQQKVVMSSSNDIDECNVKSINDNTIYFYQDINNITMFALKNEIQKMNKNFDMILAQFDFLKKENMFIDLHINSGGGNVFQSLHLYDVIKNNKYKIHTHIDAVACSGATLLFLAGHKRTMHDNSFVLIHEMRTFIGYMKFSELEDEKDNKTKFMDKVKKIYLDELNINKQQLQGILKRDLFLSREQADKYGFEK